jgi:two-component system chemotaxis response regulator CheY
LALVDWNMPEMGGLDLVRHVRADGRFKAMRLIMVTTETDLKEVHAAIECGVNEYVMKPFTKEIIADKLHLVGL